MPARQPAELKRCGPAPGRTTLRAVRTTSGRPERRNWYTFVTDFVAMSGAARQHITESEESEDDSRPGEHGETNADDVPMSSAQESDGSVGTSDLGRRKQRRRHEWETVKTWDPVAFEEKHILDSIEGLAREYMKAGGVTFVASLKQKPKNLATWVFRSAKQNRGQDTLVSSFILKIGIFN